MSSRDYSVNDFGYVFNAEMIDQIIEKVKPKNIQTGDTYEMAEIMGLQYIGEFTGEAIRLDELGDDDFHDDAWSYSADSIFYFPKVSLSMLYISPSTTKVLEREGYSSRVPHISRRTSIGSSKFSGRLLLRRISVRL